MSHNIDPQLYTVKFSPGENYPYKDNAEDFEVLKMSTLSVALSSKKEAELMVLRKACRFEEKVNTELEKRIKAFKEQIRAFNQNEAVHYDKLTKGYVLNKEELHDTPIELSLPKGAEVLSVKGFRKRDIILFVSYDINQTETENRTFLLVPINEAYKSQSMVFIDTVVFAEGKNITHVFEIKEKGK